MLRRGTVNDTLIEGRHYGCQSYERGPWLPISRRALADKFTERTMLVDSIFIGDICA